MLAACGFPNKRGDLQVDAPITPQLIWDLPTRVFHWLLVVCVLGAWLTAESERSRMQHLALGYSAGVLVAWRVIWGFVGGRYARFTGFVRSPAAAWTYLRAYLPAVRRAGQTQTHYLGHNPAGGWAVMALLAAVALVVATGWVSYQDGSAELWCALHGLVGKGIILLVGLHVLAVLATGFMHRENLVRAMWTGRKRAQPEQGVVSSYRVIGLALCFATIWFGWAVYTDRFPGLST
jgi:cytochrome b